MGFNLFAGAAIVTSVYAASALLTVALPGRKVVGYACDVYTGKPLIYRLNGLFVLLAILATFVALSLAKIINISYIAQNYGAAAFAANAYGLIGSALLYAQGRALPEKDRQPYKRCPTRDKPEKAVFTKADLVRDEEMNPLKRFFLGQEFNPRAGLFDVKMFLYVVGAVMLGLNVYSAAGLQAQLDGSLSRASVVYASLFTHFLVEYLFFEEIHLYTYDLFCEKVGFKLFWGCFVFYPFFYAIGSRGIIYHQPNVDMNSFQCILAILTFYTGWIFTRGANLQKYYFKQNPESTTVFFGLMKQQTIPGSKILCSGFWGLSRHINYFGEIVQAIALALPGWIVSGSLIPWLYPLYYIGLFVTRQIDDDRICLAKYGEPWKIYMEKVPYRICPYVW